LIRIFNSNYSWLAGIKLPQLLVLMEEAGKELHHGRSAKVDELLSSSEMPLACERSVWNTWISYVNSKSLIFF